MAQESETSPGVSCPRDRPSWPAAVKPDRRTSLPSLRVYRVRVPQRSLRRFHGEWAMCVAFWSKCDSICLYQYTGTYISIGWKILTCRNTNDYFEYKRQIHLSNNHLTSLYCHRNVVVDLLSVPVVEFISVGVQFLQLTAIAGMWHADGTLRDP